MTNLDECYQKRHIITCDWSKSTGPFWCINCYFKPDKRDYSIPHKPKQWELDFINKVIEAINITKPNKLKSYNK